MIKYGLISETDAKVLEKTIDLLLADDSHNYQINVTEIGVYGGDTGSGICEYIKSKGRNYWIIGIDSFKDSEVVRFPYNEMIYGNSNEVYNQIEDNSQHLIFIDSNHSFPYVVSDYYCYRHKVKIGGYLAFHDCADHIKPLTDYQGIGSKEDPDMYISVKKALQAVGLVDPLGKDWANTVTGFEFVLYDADVNNPAGGISVFKRLR